MPHRYTSSAPDVITAIALDNKDIGFIFANKQDEEQSITDNPQKRTASDIASTLLSRSATTRQKSATEKYANLDINRELHYREKEERNQDTQLNERKSNIWSSIKRKVSMTSLASQTLSSVSTATKRTKKSSFSSLQPEVEQPECENEGKRSTESAPEKGTQTSGLSGLRRAATVSGQPRKHPQRKRETQDDSAIDSNGRNLKKPPSSLVLGFFDPDNGIAIGKYNIAHKSTFSKSEKTKKKKKEECDYFYEPNTALAIGKLDDFGSFPESPLKSPLSRSRTTKHKRLSKSNDNIEDGLPVSDIAANLGQNVSKLATQKVLNVCAERGLITSKTYGKQSVFVANQNDDNDDISPEEKEALIVDNDTLSKECKSLNEQIGHFNNEINAMKKLPAFNELPALIEQQQKRIIELDLYINESKDLNNMVSSEELAKVDSEFIKWKTLYRKRLRKYKDVRDALCGDEATKEDIMNLDQELGLEELDDDLKDMLKFM
ncbi:hypothetical protein E3Q18_02434 [Wallemia mellicola]|uniref:Homologous-pairing protein 2 winged helix domain-containing protein n=1 Tax=Wallemia mellicola TaxID=1708541 RepID=A0A4T0N5K6_9BASI|nr:hypothetical protein E3Q23_02252 [Wallemia mellicola]TIB91815.1 hypothetical protein E3Q19_02234 [Wallemia mellicola]TIB97685.1 hypothetical protein E3Q18_02434 [Wallemia mellicola]TIC00033.1 hypothetical protein E3Q17_02344 [Wallemia mellicola]TIC11146.1 hypothetical protein E3Q14_02422 [Wallemia mellicola]